MGGRAIGRAGAWLCRRAQHIMHPRRISAGAIEDTAVTAACYACVPSSCADHCRLNIQYVIQYMPEWKMMPASAR